MKKFALYLPQFHEIEENNEWWVKGFTEWTHVKAAKPLFEKHQQPQEPLNNNYYNLLDKETVQWQTNLASEYGIDGFVYYHYYFEGKLIMEKPAENLLAWKDISQKFFFCWANHSWYKAVDGKKTLLIEQTYGNEEEWEKHFEYLLPFFLDKRYEKKDNKPLFMIFNSDYSEMKRMFLYFDKKCKENGFAGIYLIETYMGNADQKSIQTYATQTCEQTQMLYLREPVLAQKLMLGEFHSLKWYMKAIWNEMHKRIAIKFKGFVPKYSGSKMFQLMAKKEEYKIDGVDIAHGLFFGWDNTPRHGSRGYIITCPEEQYVLEYYYIIKNDEYVFINAWNEWAEGMMLEPTEKDGYRNLELIKKLK